MAGDRVSLKRLSFLFMIFTFSGCLSAATLRQRVVEALPGSSVGATLYSKSEIGCAYAEFEYPNDRTIPESISGRKGELGEFWVKASSLDEMDTSIFTAHGYNINYMAQALVTARNCAPDIVRFYKMTGETPSYFSTSMDGEEFLIIPMDPSLPVLYLVGQI
jgi:hypothetical protein